MATQLKHTDFAYTPTRTPRPNIRVAFIAGEATTAIHEAMAKLPAETRDGTLDDLVPNQGVAAAPTWDQAVTALAVALAARDEFHSTVLAPHHDMMETMKARGEDIGATFSDHMKIEEQHGDLAMAVVNATCALGLVPAPGATELAYKVHALVEDDFHLNERKVSELVAALDRDAQAILGTKASDDVDMIRSMTCTLIETARELLSPTMYTGFLRWGETASHASSFCEDDEDCNARCIAAADARSLVSGTTAENMHDLLFMTLLAFIEVADAPSFGPFDRKYGDFDVNGGELLGGISKGLRKFSPIPDLFNELSSRAWEVSKCRLAISADIGRAITSAFSFARGENSVRRDGDELATGPEAPLLAAFATRRHEFEAADKGPWTAEQEDAYFARVDAAEMVLLDTRATTLEGVIAKLRVAFMNQDGSDWSDLAISNTSDPKFVEGLRMSGMYERMAWAAIEDLARIGGVSLPEQGA
jgi:hypothetical protein